MFNINLSIFNRSLAAMFLAVVAVVLLFSAPALAEEPTAAEGDGGNATGQACGVETVILGCSGAGDNPIIRVFMEVFNFFAVGIGILTVAGIILGGIKYATANGNTSQAEQGITTIVNAVIGLLLFIFMFALLNWLVPGGLFS
jgi:hypothetical protein